MMQHNWPIAPSSILGPKSKKFMLELAISDAIIVGKKSTLVYVA